MKTLSTFIAEQLTEAKKQQYLLCSQAWQEGNHSYRICVIEEDNQQIVIAEQQFKNKGDFERVPSGWELDTILKQSVTEYVIDGGQNWKINMPKNLWLQFKKEASKINESVNEANVVETKDETGLMIYPSSATDFMKLNKIIDDIDFYGEVRNDHFFFPEEPESYDELEKELDKIFNKNRISVRYESV